MSRSPARLWPWSSPFPSHRFLHMPFPSPEHSFFSQSTSLVSSSLYISFLKDSIYFGRQGKDRRNRRETLMCERIIDRLTLTRPQPGIWPATQACALTGNQTGDLLVCGTMPNPLSHTSQGSLSLRPFLRSRFLQEAFLVSQTCPGMYFPFHYKPYRIHLYVPVDVSLSHNTRKVLRQQERAVLSFVRAHSAPASVCLIV